MKNNQRQTKSKKSSLALLFIAMCLLPACAKKGSGFDSSSSDTTATAQDSSNSQSQDNPQTPAPQSPSAPSWDQVDMDGYASGGAYNGKMAVRVDKNAQALTLLLPIPMPVPLIGTMNIPSLPGAKLASTADGNGKELLALQIPLKYIIKGAALGQGQSLPNGDPLPYVPAGELPGFSIQLPQIKNYRIYVYLGVNVVATYIELPDFGLPIGWISPVKNKAKTRVIGAIGYVPPKMNYAGGMYLATQIPAKTAQLIDNLIQW